MGCRYRTGVLPGIPGGEVRETLRRHGHPRWSPLLAYPLQWSGASYRGPLPIQHYHISMSIPTTPTITQPAAPPFPRATFPPPPPPRPTSSQTATDGELVPPKRTPTNAATLRYTVPPPQAQQRTLQLAQQPATEAQTRERERTPPAPVLSTRTVPPVLVRHHAISSPAPASPTSTAANAAARRHSLLPPPALASPTSTAAAVAARC